MPNTPAATPAREACYCPERHPEISCAACHPVTCPCGRQVPLATLRKAFRSLKGVACRACGWRMGADDVGIAYLGL